MAYEVSRARAIYASARTGLRALAPSGRATALAAATLYSRILDEIETLDFDVFNARAHVSTAKKVRALPGILVDLVNLSASRPAAMRSAPAGMPMLGQRHE
jgi:phytoene synthase